MLAISTLRRRAADLGLRLVKRNDIWSIIDAQRSWVVQNDLDLAEVQEYVTATASAG